MPRAAPRASRAMASTRSPRASCAARCRTTSSACIRTSACCIRSCAPAPRARARFRQASWDEALALAADGLRSAIERHGGASIAPYSYLGTQGLVQGDIMANRLLDALGGSTLVRTICASAGVAGTMATNGASPEVDPEEWVHARTIVVWGWNPLSTAPHLWRLVLEARKRGARLIVVDPFRSRTARVADVHLRPLPGTDAALALGVMRALLDAGPRRSRVVSRARARLRRARRAARRRDRRPAVAALRRPGGRYPRARALARAGSAVADPPRRRRAAPRRCADRVPHDRLHPGARGLLAAPRRRARLHPDGDVRRARRGAAATASSADGARALAQHVAARRGAHRSGDRSARGGADRLELEPGGDRARSGARARGPAPRRPVHDRVRAVHDRHRGARRRDPARDDPARASRRRLVVGTPLPDAQRAGDRAARRGALQQRDLPARSRARSASPTRASRRRTRRCSRARSRATRRASAWPACARAATPRSTAARAQRPTPKAASRRRRASSSCAATASPRPGSTRCRSTTRPARSPTSSSHERYPLALLTPKTHLFLNSTFANGRRQHAAQPEPYVVIHPDDAAPRGIAEGATVRVHNDRGSFVCRAKVSDDARAGRAGGADGLVEPRLRGRPEPTGDDTAAPDDAAGRAHVQRQPRRDRGWPPGDPWVCRGVGPQRRRDVARAPAARRPTSPTA